MVIVINNINNLGEHRDRFRDQPLGKNVMKLLQRLIFTCIVPKNFDNLIIQ